MKVKNVEPLKKKKRGRPCKSQPPLSSSSSLTQSSSSSSSSCSNNPPTSSSSSSSSTLAPKNQIDHCFSRDDLIQGLRKRQFRHVSFMVGAGVSVAAGIPDFRSPQSGLYAQVKQMGLPCPEDIFSIDYLVDDPQPFFTLAKRLLYDVQPVQAHYFMKQCQDHRILHMVYTQNIDGLELIAGISMKKVLQAHGHMRTAHCIECKKCYEMTSFTEYARREEIMHCQHCSHGIVKPDIIFFGEKVPKSFTRQLERIESADLVIVMGTSLQVRPFSELLQHIHSTTPIVIINRDLPKQASQVCGKHAKLLFLQGDIEETIGQLTRDLEWDLQPSSSSSVLDKRQCDDEEKEIKEEENEMIKVEQPKKSKQATHHVVGRKAKRQKTTVVDV
eukprot:gene8613-9492_t